MSKSGICIFGGSFDPVHKGHRKLADFVCESLNIRRMLIIPTAMSPFKNSSGAGEAQRLEMCRLAFSEDIFEVTALEIERGGKSYTIDTVNAVKELYPEEKIYLLIGSDQLLSFDRWYRFKDILSLVTLVSVSRESSKKKEELECFSDERLRPFGECIILDFEPLEVSSTLLRSIIGKNQDASLYIEEKISAYIHQKGLYKDE